VTQRCDDGHCVTCSDEGIPMQVVDVADDQTARCRDDVGADSVVMTDLLGAVRPGETVLVHAGVALARVDGGAG
jgi:hydrogenase maturation factor